MSDKDILPADHPARRAYAQWKTTKAYAAVLHWMGPTVRSCDLHCALWEAFLAGWLADPARGSMVVGDPPAAAPVDGAADLAAHLVRQQQFSAMTFGPGMRTEAVVAHIRKELIEVLKAPADLEEWVDVLMLALDGAWRCVAYTSEDVTPDQVAWSVVGGLQMKFRKNQQRTWPDWRTVPAGQPIEHVKGEAAHPRCEIRCQEAIACSPGRCVMAESATPRQPNPDEVICPECTHQFRAVPVNVQAELAEAKRLVREFRDLAVTANRAGTVKWPGVALSRVMDAVGDASRLLQEDRRLGVVLDPPLQDAAEQARRERSAQAQEGRQPIGAVLGASAACGQRQHLAGANCWCQPQKVYTDPVTGASVYVHTDPH